MASLEQYYDVTDTPHDVIAEVVDSAEIAYRSVGALKGVSPDLVHRKGWCIEVVDAMGNNICNVKSVGYQAALISSSHMLVDHVFISLYPPGSDRQIIADPTWQQFLPYHEATSRHVGGDLPKLLLGTREEVGRQAISYGFDEEEIRTWVGDSYLRPRPF